MLPKSKFKLRIYHNTLFSLLSMRFINNTKKPIPYSDPMIMQPRDVNLIIRQKRLASLPYSLLRTIAIVKSALKK